MGRSSKHNGWLAEKEDIDGKIEGMHAEVVNLCKIRDKLKARNNAIREEAKIRVGYVPPMPTPTPTPDPSTQSVNCPVIYSKDGSCGSGGTVKDS